MYKVEHTTIFNLELAFIFCSSTHTVQLRAEAEMQLAGLLERLRWSTSPLSFGCLLLDHVIYLKLVNKQLFANSLNDSYVHSYNGPSFFLIENSFHFVNLFSFANNYLFLSLR